MTGSIEEIRKESETRMGKAIETLKANLAKMRTGRAHAGLLDSVRVDAYGSKQPLNQVAGVAVTDARTLTVSPWDKGLAQAVEKAIRESDLGLNPVSAGGIIRVPMPSLTEERRRELGKHVKTEGEDAKVAVRNARREANQHVKELLKKKLITEDDDRRAEADIQKATDRYVADIDKLVEAKARELMQI